MRRATPWWFQALACLSGAAGLGYELLWTRMLAVSLGHESAAVLAVLAAFFVGISLGAWLLGARLRASSRPARWYVGLELVIGGWALALIGLLPVFNDRVPRWIGTEPSPLVHWGVAFFGTMVLLLPATSAMGATLPALERALYRASGDSRQVAGLYAANTLGAVCGALLSTFWLAGSLGFARTLMVFAACNALAAALMIWLGHQAAHADATRSTSGLPARSARGTLQLLGALALTGFAGIGYEVAAVRVLSQVLADTIYTFATLLCVYLLGTSLGAALWQRHRAHRVRLEPSPDRERSARSVLAIATTGACLQGLACLWLAPALHEGASTTLGSGLVAGVLAELWVAAWVFLLPSMCMGALFCHLAQLAAPRLGLGPALAVNTLGAALAPPVVGVLMLPRWEAKASLLALSLSYLLVASPTLGRLRGRSTVRWTGAAVAAAAALIALLSPALRFVEVPPGGKLAAHREGVMASVSVTRDARGAHYLSINHLTMGSSATAFSDHRQAHLPLLWHGSPRRALLLGVGTGMTFDAARNYPELEVTGVELIPEVLPLLHHFDTDPAQRAWLGTPRLLAADARRFVLSDTRLYDVVIADLFHPWTEGSGSLYTLEHFQAIGARLAPGGLFCQWLPLYQLDEATLATILRTFVVAFPHAQAHLGHLSLEQPILALVGSHGPLAVSHEGWLEARVHQPSLQRELVLLRLNSDFALFGGYVASREALAQFAGQGPLNTDDRPIVAFSSPGFIYGSTSPPAQHLLSVVEGTAKARGLHSPNSAFEARLLSYWEARDAFLHAGVGVQPTSDASAMLAQVRGPLLEAVKLSADFSPAYTPLLGIARGVYPQDPQAARELLTELAAIRPERPEASSLRRRMFGE